MTEQKVYPLQFRGGKMVSLVPLILMICGSLYFFVIAEVFSLEALAMAGFVALILGSLLSKNITLYWETAIKGMSTELANTIVLILFVVGIFSKMMVRGGVAESFVWIGSKLNITGGAFTAFTFVAAGLLALSTGTSIGTLLTTLPILYPSGLLLGADPILLVGAIMSGAMFGDSLGPISDVTIASCQTQEYTNRNGFAQIPETVSTRFKFSIAASIPVFILFFFLGGSNQTLTAEGSAALASYANPKGLLMILPVVVLLFFAIRTRNIFIAATSGILSGTLVALVFGIFPASEIMMVEEGVLQGFLIEGILNVMGTVCYVYALMAIMGILRASGFMDSLIEALVRSSLAKTVWGSELLICLGGVFTCFCIGAANGPACVMFGPIVNEIGKKANLHPTRRAHLLAAFTSSLPVMVPFASIFISITMSQLNALRLAYDFIPPISPAALPAGCFFLMTFPLVFLFSIFTGWGRDYEGPNGERVREKKKILKA